MILVLIILLEIFTANIQEVHGVDTFDKLKCYDPLDYYLTIQKNEVKRALNKLENEKIPPTSDPAALDKYIVLLAGVATEARALPKKGVSKAINIASNLLSKLNKDNKDKTTAAIVLNKVTPILGSLTQVPKDQISATDAKQLITSIEILPKSLTSTQQGAIVENYDLNIGSKTVSDTQRKAEALIDFSTSIFKDMEGQAHVPKFFINLKAKDIESDRVDLAVLKNGDLFQAMMPTQNNITGQIISPVISVSAKLRPIEPNRTLGNKPVRLRFTHSHGFSLGVHTCVFWNFTLLNWNNTGCRPLFNVSGANEHVCECDHLTFFALLFVPQNTDYNLSTKMIKILNVLTFCLLTVSCTALFSTIFIYFLYLQRIHSNRNRYVVQYQSGQIVMCMCFSLLVGHVTFLIGSNYGYNDRFCKVIAGIIHFAYLCAFSWSTVEGSNLYFSFIAVALSNKRMASSTSSDFFLKASVFAWGIPIAIVGTTFGTGMDNYGLPIVDGEMKADKLCFLRPLAFYLAFLTPLLISLLTNIVIIILLAIALYRHSRSRLVNAEDSKQRIIGFIGICINLNVTWGFGVIQILFQHAFTMYLFVVLNGIQGLLIFIFYCIVRSNIRKFLIQIQRESFTLPGSTTTIVSEELIDDM